jgi:hypothetical protein
MEYRDRAEVLELVGKIFDRLENENDQASGQVLDAVLIVEVDTGEREPVPNDDTHERVEMPTVILKESTTERTTVERGMLDFARENMWSDYDD